MQNATEAEVNHALDPSVPLVPGGINPAVASKIRWISSWGFNLFPLDLEIWIDLEFLV
jgi:hypothetical protein